MTRSELRQKMVYHEALAQALLDVSGRPHKYMMESLAAANAHASLAIFYQGELRENQP